jgi:hypothetical protein
MEAARAARARVIFMVDDEIEGKVACVLVVVVVVVVVVALCF